MRYALRILLLILLSIYFFNSKALSQMSVDQAPCAIIINIKSIPYKPGDANKADPMYKEYFELVNQGENAIPCLIENISNTNEMKDPRCPSVGMIAVGDIAYFVLYRIGKFDFTEMFSPEIQKAYKTDGIYGYLALIDENGNRAKLQTKLKEWYSSRNQTK